MPDENNVETSTSFEVKADGIEFQMTMPLAEMGALKRLCDKQILQDIPKLTDAEDELVGSIGATIGSAIELDLEKAQAEQKEQLGG